MKYLNKRGMASSINIAKFGSKQRTDVIWRDIRRIWSSNVDYFEQFKDNKILKDIAESYCCAEFVIFDDVIKYNYEPVIKAENVPDTPIVRFWIKQALKALIDDFDKMLNENHRTNILRLFPNPEDSADFEPIPETHDEYCERECV